MVKYLEKMHGHSSGGSGDAAAADDHNVDDEDLFNQIGSLWSWVKKSHHEGHG